MKLAQKELEYYIEIIKLPFLALVAISILQIIVAFIPGVIGIGLSWFAGIVSFIVGLGCIIYIGWSVVKQHKGEIIHSFFAGALLGIASAIINLISGLITLPTVATKINTLGAGGMMGASFTVAAVIVGFLVGIIIAPLIGGGLCALTSLIVKEM
jgi:hypothetical protein